MSVPHFSCRARTGEDCRLLITSSPDQKVVSVSLWTRCCYLFEDPNPVKSCYPLQPFMCFAVLSLCVCTISFPASSQCLRTGLSHPHTTQQRPCNSEQLEIKPLQSLYNADKGLLYYCTPTIPSQHSVCVYSAGSYGHPNLMESLRQENNNLQHQTH